MLETQIITSSQLVKEHIGSPEESWHHFESKISQEEAMEIIARHIEEAPEIDPDAIEEIRQAKGVEIKTGSQADFYLLPNRPLGLKWISRADHRFTKADISAEEKEFQMQVLFYVAAEKWKEKFPDKGIQIPRPWSCLISDSKDIKNQTPWISMEALEGETLFHKMFKHIIRKAYDEYTNTDPNKPWESGSQKYHDLKNLDAIPERQIDISSLDEISDQELIGTVQKLLILPNANEISDPAQKEAQQNQNEQRIYKAANNLGFELDPEKIKNLREFIAFANSLGLYHRDLHAKNVFILPNGDFGIIDFGTAELVESGNPYEINYLGDTFSLASDNAIFPLLNVVSNKDSEVEKMHQQEVLAHQDPGKLLFAAWPSGDSLLKVIQTIKKRNPERLARIADSFCQNDPYVMIQLNKFASPGNFIKHLLRKEQLESSDIIKELFKSLEIKLKAETSITDEERATILTSLQNYVKLARNSIGSFSNRGGRK